MKRQGTTILVIDDDPNDRFMIERAFRKNGVRDTIHLLAGGSEAIDYLNGEGKFADRKKFEFPSLVITDLKMPEVDGFGVLKHIKRNPQWAVIPTIMLSGSADTNDIKNAYLWGAASFLNKPASPTELQDKLKKLYDYWIIVEVPQILPSGEMEETESRGKMGEE
ncbi:MAG: response regulator [Limisphaerales bacterium]